MVDCPEYPYKNLVFAGSGFRVFGYIGGIEVLEEMGVLSQIKRFGGASGGALIAALLTLGYSVAELKKIMLDLDLDELTGGTATQLRPSRLIGVLGKHNRALRRKLQDVGGLLTLPIQRYLGITGYGLEYLASALDRIEDFSPNGLVNFIRLGTTFGWFSGEPFEELFEDLVYEKTKNREFTFDQLPKFSDRELHIVATDLSAGTFRVLSTANTPEYKISTSLRATTAVPFIFNRVKINGNTFVDGSVCWDYPLQLFDDKKYLDTPCEDGDDDRQDEEGRNLETLGFNFMPPPESYRPVNTIFQYGFRTLQAFVEAQFNSFLHNRGDRNRTILIDDLDIPLIDSNLSRQQRLDLIEEGKKATRRYFQRKERGEEEPPSYPSTSTDV